MNRAKAPTTMEYKTANTSVVLQHQGPADPPWQVQRGRLERQPLRAPHPPQDGVRGVDPPGQGWPQLAIHTTILQEKGDPRRGGGSEQGRKSSLGQVFGCRFGDCRSSAACEGRDRMKSSGGHY